MKNKENYIKVLDNDEFHQLYLNYKHDFYGNNLEDNKIALHARKKVGEEMQWREIEMNSDNPKVVSHYIDVLKNDFE